MAISGGIGFRIIVNITTVPVSLSYIPDTIYIMKRNLCSCEKFSALANMSLIVRSLLVTEHRIRRYKG